MSMLVLRGVFVRLGSGEEAYWIVDELLSDSFLIVIR